MITQESLKDYQVGTPGPGLLLGPFEFENQASPDAVRLWHEAFRNLPQLIAENRVAEALHALPEFPIDDARYANPNNLMTDRIMFAAFASAYLNFEPDIYDEAGVAVLPKAIAHPLVEISKRIGLPPFLAYSDYVLANNGSRLTWDGPYPIVENMRVQFPFMGTENERGFIGIHLSIEAIADEIYQAIPDILVAAQARDEVTLTERLNEVGFALEKMRYVLTTITEHCDPEKYLTDTRQFIMGIAFNKAFKKGVRYEGEFGEAPQFFRGQTGGETPTIPVGDALFGIPHVDEGEQNANAYLEFREGMLPAHRAFIADIAALSEVRAACMEGSDALKEAYNRCIIGIARFRGFHKSNATETYLKDIQSGTGGSALSNYLEAHIRHTIDMLLPLTRNAQPALQRA